MIYSSLVALEEPQEILHVQYEEGELGEGEGGGEGVMGGGGGAKMTHIKSFTYNNLPSFNLRVI